MKVITSLFLLFFVTIHAFAQDRVITGTVTAKEDGLPIPGVSVLVVGTKIGTQTGINGQFTLKVPESGKQLEFSFIGYGVQRVDVGSDKREVNVTLITNSKQLSEIVVTATGARVEKDKLGSSQSTVKGSALAESGETSVLNALSGKAAGVQIGRTGGDPGAGSYIQIRGQSTITGNLQPLFIIDGIPVSNETYASGSGGTTATDPNLDITTGTVQQSRLNDLNPDDIESMEVLKGTAAAALWGTRAANGVIIITTKKGKASPGKINVSLNSTYSIDVLNKSVPLQTAYGQGTDGLYENDYMLSWGDKIAERLGGPDNYITTGGYVILPDGSKRYPIANGVFATPHGGKNSRDVFDHATELFNNGYYLDNTLTLSGGDDKTLYYISLGNLDQQGIFKTGSDYHRKSFKINADRRFGDRLKLNTSMNYINTKSKRVQQGSNTSGIFLGGLRSSPDFDNTFYQGDYVNASGAVFPNRQITYRNSIGSEVNSTYDNPFWILNRITSTTAVNRFLGSFEAKYDAMKWMSFILRSGLDYYSDNRVDNYPVLSSSFNNGSLTLQEISELQFNTDLIGKVTRSVAKDINLTALVGLNYNNRTYENLGTTARDFIIPDAPFDLANSAAASRFPFNEQTLIRTTAIYSQLSFEIFDQLFADITGRAEQSSTFLKTFFYPSISLAWQFTKQKSFENITWLSFGKLRASYGEVGVQPKPYLSSTYYIPSIVKEGYGPALDGSAPTYGGGYMRSLVKGNPDLKPERKKEFEIGTDLRFLSDKLTLSGVYYLNKTIGAIFPVEVPATTGFSQINDNAAEIQNKGFELEIGVNKWYEKKNFSISSNLTWSTNRNKVVDLKGVKSLFLNGFAGISSKAVEGEPLGVLWGTDFNRDGNGKLILDANGFPTSAANEGVIGNPNPDWIGSFGTTFRYKNFNVKILIDHVQGGDVWNGTRGILLNFGTHKDTGNEVIAPSDLKTVDGNTISAGTAFRGAVTDFGNGPVALTQAWYNDLGGGFGPVNSQFVEKGTRTRLRELSLGYVLSGEKFMQKTKFQSIEFSISGRNLALWTNYSGIDPETNATGVTNGRGLDYFNNPSTRSYFFSVKINY